MKVLLLTVSVPLLLLTMPQPSPLALPERPTAQPYGFESDGDRFALFAPREKTAPSVGASEETYPHVGYAVFLPQQLMDLR